MRRSQSKLPLGCCDESAAQAHVSVLFCLADCSRQELKYFRAHPAMSDVCRTAASTTQPIVPFLPPGARPSVRSASLCGPAQRAYCGHSRAVGCNHSLTAVRVTAVWVVATMEVRATRRIATQDDLKKMQEEKEKNRIEGCVSSLIVLVSHFREGAAFVTRFWTARTQRMPSTCRPRGCASVSCS